MYVCINFKGMSSFSPHIIVSSHVVSEKIYTVQGKKSEKKVCTSRFFLPFTNPLEWCYFRQNKIDIIFPKIEIKARVLISVLFDTALGIAAGTVHFTKSRICKDATGNTENK